MSFLPSRVLEEELKILGKPLQNLDISSLNNSIFAPVAPFLSVFVKTRTKGIF